MEHEMLLLDADYRTVCARMTVRRKGHAIVAQVTEHCIRNAEGEILNISDGPKNSGEEENSAL